MLKNDFEHLGFCNKQLFLITEQIGLSVKKTVGADKR